MEQVGIEGASRLLDFGVLGVVCLMCGWVIYYLNKQAKRTNELLIKSKDDEANTWKEIAKEHSHQVTALTRELGENLSRLTDLYERQEIVLRDIPHRTAQEIQLLDKK